MANMDNSYLRTESAGVHNIVERWSTVFMFLAVALIFIFLDTSSIFLGDDFGYMFTDEKLHGGGGHIVTSFADCWQTQLNHYNTTNGRFLVHLLTQVFLNLTPIWIYKSLNAIVFALLWLYMAKLAMPQDKRVSEFTGELTWTSIWLLMPQPGLVMLSLVAFSLNYMWSGAVTVIFLWYYRQVESADGVCRVNMFLLALLALIAGSLQESYSLPLAGALVLSPILMRRLPKSKEIIIALAYISGTLICAAAPGNMNHLDSGGGLEPASVVHKAISATHALVTTPVVVLAVCLAIYACVDKKGVVRFMRDNNLLLLAIVLGIGFAMLSFTAVRQLYSISIFSIILLLRMPVWKSGLVCRHASVIGRSLLILTCILLSVAYYMRLNNFNIFRQTLHAVENSASVAGGDQYVAWTDVTNANYNRTPVLYEVLKGYAPDPWERTYFSIPFNNQVKRIMSRLYTDNGDSHSLAAILPYPPLCLVERWQKSTRSEPIEIDARYALYAIPMNGDAANGMKATGNAESFTYSDTIYYVIPK